MSLRIGDNFSYLGKKFLDSRESFDTLQEMYTCTDVPEGFITYCKEDEKRYEFKENQWIEFVINSNGISEELELIETSDIEPSNDKVSIWINTSDDTVENVIARINDKVVSSSTTWSSEQTKKYIDNAQLGGGEGGTIDLSDYAKKIELPKKISDLENDSDFITSIPSEYVTDNELNAKGYLTEHQSLDDYAKKTDIPSLDDYATEDYVDTAIADAQLGGDNTEIDLSDYATKDDLKAKADEKHTHDEYLTEHQDLSEYAKKSEIPNDYLTEIPSEYITETELNNKGYLTEHQSLNEYAKKSDIPSLDGYATEDYVDTAIANAQLGGEEVDLSGYAKKSELPTKTSQLTNDSNFLTSIPNEYITESELNDKGYLTEHQSLEGYAKTTDIPTIPTNLSAFTNDTGYLTSVPTDYAKKSDIPTDYLTSIPSEYVTDDELTAKGYLTEHQSLEGYAKTSDIPSLEGYAKTSDIPTDYLTEIPSEYVTDTELTAKGYLTEHQSLSDYAKKSDIPTVPTKVSELANDKNYLTSIPSEYITESELNDKGYLTEHQDLSDYALKSQIPTNYLTSIPSEYITESELNAKNYLTSIPSEYVTETELTNKGYLTQHQDLSTYAKKSEIPTVTNDLTNALKSNYDSAYTHSTSSHAPSNAQKNSDITKTEIENKLTGNITSHTHSQYLTEHQSLSDYAKKSDIPSVPTKTSQLTNDSNFLTSVPSEYITESELNDKGYLTEHQSLDEYLKVENSHSHSNKGVLDNITNDGITKWNKSIPFEDSYISNATEWLNNGYTKTSTSTSNLPSICTDSDRWGVLFYISENTTNRTGTQMYYPIDGTHKGRVFTRSILQGNATSDWLLLSIFDGNYDSLTNKPTIPTSISQLTNDSNYLTSIPSEYITETELNSKGYLTEHQDLSDYALKSQIPTNYLTSIPSEYITESELNAKGYATTSQIPTVPSSLPANGGNADTVDNFHIVKLTQSQYNALSTKNSNTLYLIVE